MSGNASNPPTTSTPSTPVSPPTYYIGYSIHHCTCIYILFKKQQHWLILSNKSSVPEPVRWYLPRFFVLCCAWQHSTFVHVETEWQTQLKKLLLSKNPLSKPNFMILWLFSVFSIIYSLLYYFVFLWWIEWRSSRSSNFYFLDF